MALVCEAVDLLTTFFGFRLFNGPNHEALKLELRDVENEESLGFTFRSVSIRLLWYPAQILLETAPVAIERVGKIYPKTTH